jgi:cytochrome c oxidase subunit 2
VEWLVNPASVQGIAMRTGWYVFVGAGTFVGIFVYGCILWCLISYRERRGRAAQQFSGNTPIEILYVVLPFAMVLFLFGVTLAIETKVDHVTAAPSNRIAVSAFRWSWRFQYPNGMTTVGTPMKPPTLYLPIGEETQIELRSDDVTHSFWIPAFLFKRDAIPGMTNVFDLTPNRAGTFPSRCAQFCGLDHAVMTFVVRTVPRSAYQRYIASEGAVMP